MPIRIPELAGELYQPSNGCEGEMFMERFCYRCKKETPDSPCEIIALSMCYEPKDEEYPRAWKYDGEGCPTCTEFEAADVLAESKGEE